MKKGKKNKYHAVKTEMDGIKFDSKREAQRYVELKALLAAGVIDNLEMQPPYKIVWNGVKVCKYIADFRYTLVETGVVVVEDVKSVYTAKLDTYRLKKKLMLACHGIEVQEVIR